VLSALVLSQPLIDELRDVIEPIDFYVMQHRLLFEALLALDAAGTKIDHVTLTHRLRASAQFTQIGGSKFLAEIFDATPSVAHVADHARIIRQLGVLRRMGGTLLQLAAIAQTAETRGNVPAFLERCEAEVFGANVSTSDRETGSSLRDMMTSAITLLDPNIPQQARGVSTGLAELDELTHGLVPGELWYVAARPGMGKTALALGIAANVARCGRHALFFSMEMKRPELSERIISSDSAVPYKALQKRQLSADQWSDITQSADRLSRMPLIIDDASQLTPSRLRSRVRRHASALRAAHQGELALVVVDYVQLMAWDNSKGNRNDDLENISRALKILAGELNVTVLACAQLNRTSKDRADKRPTLTDLRGSGALEQDADKVLFVHRDGEESESDSRGEADLILGKGRNAALGKVSVGWQPWCVRFVEQQQGFRFAGDFGPTDYGD
jgi:replicative DNA helicase